MENVVFKKMLAGVLDKVHPANWEFINLDEDVEEGITEDNEESSDIPINLHYVSTHNIEADTGTFGILIFFPKLVCTNTYGHKVTIEELYVVVPFIDRQLYMVGCTKVSASSNELSTAFTHSHSPKGPSAAYFGRMCTGGVGIAAYEYNVCNQYFDETSFEAYLYALDAFLEWESLEGTPHKFLLDRDTVTGKAITVENLVTPEFIKALPEYTTLTPDSTYKFTKVYVNFEEELLALLKIPEVFIDNNGNERNARLSSRSLPNGLHIDRHIGKLHVVGRLLSNEVPDLTVGENISELSVPAQKDFISKYELSINKTLLWMQQS